MHTHSRRQGRNFPNRAFLSLWVILLCGIVFVQPVIATTYISAEPIPNEAIVGSSNLNKILGIGYSNLELWSNRLLNDCHIADNVIFALSSNGAITTINAGNTTFSVAAGGFEAVTNPSFVFNVSDSGTGAASAGDVNALSNTLGYVLNQGGTAHFSPDNSKAYAFSLDYAVVSFASALTGLNAKGFFDFLGTIDPALWSGTFAGFTQIGNSMLFLKPATTKQEFITGLFTAASTAANIFPFPSYATLNNNGQPTTAKAGVAFPENDWVAFPGGEQYLANLGNPSQQLLNDLAKVRQQHLEAVANLLGAIDKGNVSNYLNHQFKCSK